MAVTPPGSETPIPYFPLHTMQSASFANYAIEQARSHRLCEHDVLHPNGSVIHQDWSSEQMLHVAAVYSNPCRWRTRRHLFNDFRRHIAGLPNVRLYIGELAYGDRPFEVTSAAHPLDFQWRTRHELWHKENLLNLVIARFPSDWRYGAYVDGDFTFTRHDVALESIHELQHYDWVQMYSTYSDLSPEHRPLRILQSFAHRFATGQLSPAVLKKVAAEGYYCKPGRGVGTTGGAWAFRREAFDAVGGLLDVCILGSGDWHMAFGLAGEPDTHPQTAELSKCGVAYANAIKEWQRRAAESTRRNIGFVKCHAVHHWHGSKQQRGYGTRWKILRDEDYDPRSDIYKDWQGVYQLTANKPGLRDAIRGYFRSRVEDDIGLREGDMVLGS